ncbi:MAG: flotillin-like FloA family protein [Planctomycetota bacterium]
MTGMISAVAIAFGITCIIFLLLLVKFARPWLQAMLSGVPIPLIAVIAMWLRRIDVDLIVQTYIKLVQAEVRVPIENLERHYLAGGDVALVADALIAAKNRRQNLSFEQAAQTDLARENRK